MDVSEKDKAVAERVRLAEEAAALSRLVIEDPGAFVDQLQTAEIPVLGLLVSFLHSGHTVPTLDPAVRAFFMRQVLDILNVRHRQMESTAAEPEAADQADVAVVVAVPSEPDPAVLARRALYRNPPPRPTALAVFTPAPELSFEADGDSLRGMVLPDLLVGRIDPATEANGGMVAWSSLNGSGVTRTVDDAKRAMRSAWSSAWADMFRSPAFVAFHRSQSA